MEQLINTMLANMQMAQMAPAVKKGESSQKDGFQKLLEQKADTQAPKQEKTDAAQKPQDSQTAQGEEKTLEAEQPQQVQPAQKDDRELENQMALVAMAMMQAPVVPVEEVMTPEIQAETVAEEIAPVMAEAVVTPEVQDFTPEAKEAVEAPAAEGEAQTVDRTLAEELPQTIEAPEAASQTEGRTVETKVEAREAAPQDVEVTESEDTEEPQGTEVETPVFEDVKAVPVKVGEAPRAEKAEQPVEDQIAPKVRQALQNGETRVELQLTPENLGKITVEMTQGKDGGLVVQLHAENRETQSLLNRSSTNLAELLGRETQQEVRVEVPRQEESQRQELYEQQQEQHRRQQQEQRRKRETGGEDFLQQLRLGLIPLDGE